MKQQCWQKAEKVKGRDPDRWSRDALGNTVFRKLVGCPGCLCHDYDHIVPDSNPRSFPYSVKQQCWQKAEKVKGRDPDRWSRDALGNTVFRKLVGCPGCLCHDYDHIVPDSNPRSFPYSVKQQCWQKAEKVKGRDPDRWSRDALGNTVFRKLVACPGCLCHDYDHIVPYCKEGKSTLEKCQVLQVQQLIDQREIELRYQKPMLFRKVHTAGFQAFAGLVIPSMVDENDLGALLIGESIIMASGLFLNSSAGRDMDLLELSAYGNVRRGQDSKGCKIQ
ncbi:unnamed protein product [Camellia sinensis]